jgi:peptide/nickel transport system ATP-binding protein
MEAPVLEIQGLSIELPRRGDSRRVLSDVSFSLRPREVLGIIGESGSGKSILARAIVGSIAPPLRRTGGSVRYRGTDLIGMTSSAIQQLRGRKIGYIGSDPGNSFDPTLPVGQQLVEKLRAVRPGCGRREAADRVMALLDAVRIPSVNVRFHEFPFQYSGGMLQRAMIVDALVADPDVVIADNITQPLDVTIAAQIARLLRELREQFESAIVYIANSLAVASEVADQVAVLSGGRLVERGTADSLVHSPQHTYTRDLVDRIPRIWDVRQVPRTSTSSKEIILSVRGVTKTYFGNDRNRLFGRQAIQAVRGVDFDVHVGENFGLVGESGCGKSTLSRLLSWVEPPDRGEIHFDGRNLRNMSNSEVLAMRHRFQLLLQDPYNSMPSHLSVGRAIEEPLRIHERLGRRGRRERVLEVMNEVGLSSSDYERMPIGLSAGQMQRVNIARALVLSPKLLILDETLSSLDQMEQARLLGLFEQLQVRHRLTYLYISHDLAMVRRACNRVAVMYLGKIVELGDNDTVFVNPAHPYTRALLSAVATLEEKPFLTSECLLEGEPPSPIDLPAGCSFAVRCPLAYDKCLRSEPELLPLGSGMTACFLAQARGSLPPSKLSPSLGAQEGADPGRPGNSRDQ